MWEGLLYIRGRYCYFVSAQQITVYSVFLWKNACFINIQYDKLRNKVLVFFLNELYYDISIYFFSFESSIRFVKLVIVEHIRIFIWATKEQAMKLSKSPYVTKILISIKLQAAADIKN